MGCLEADMRCVQNKYLSRFVASPSCDGHNHALFMSDATPMISGNLILWQCSDFVHIYKDDFLYSYPSFIFLHRKQQDSAVYFY
jgi:hypothetical protein